MKKNNNIILTPNSPLISEEEIRAVFMQKKGEAYLKAKERRRKRMSLYAFGFNQKFI